MIDPCLSKYDFFRRIALAVFGTDGKSLVTLLPNGRSLCSSRGLDGPPLAIGELEKSLHATKMVAAVLLVRQEVEDGPAEELEGEVHLLVRPHLVGQGHILQPSL